MTVLIVIYIDDTQRDDPLQICSQRLGLHFVLEDTQTSRWSSLDMHCKAVSTVSDYWINWQTTPVVTTYVSTFGAVTLHQLSANNWNVTIHILSCINSNLPIPVAARSKEWVCGRSLAGTMFRIPPEGAWMFVCYECCVLTGRRLCDGLIARPEESYRVWCVCDREASILGRPWPTWGCCTMKKNYGNL